MSELFYFTNVKLRDLTFLYDNLFFHLPCLVLLFLLESLFFVCMRISIIKFWFSCEFYYSRSLSNKNLIILLLFFNFFFFRLWFKKIYTKIYFDRKLFSKISKMQNLQYRFLETNIKNVLFFSFQDKNEYRYDSLDSSIIRRFHSSYIKFTFVDWCKSIAWLVILLITLILCTKWNLT